VGSGRLGLVTIAVEFHWPHSCGRLLSMTQTANMILAALQMGSHPEGTQATLEHVLSFESDIKDAHCDLLVLPEALLGGYPKGSDFGTRVGYRTAAGRDQYLAYWQQAIELDGPQIASLCQLACRCETDLVVGVIERAGSSLYCSAVFISANQGVIATHRKLVPTASERLIWGRGEAGDMPVVELSAGRTVAAICWENYMPLYRAAMYQYDIDVWCAPTVDDRDVWQASMRHIACEGRQFLISACQVQPSAEVLGLSLDHWPADTPLIRGGSVIVSPFGDILAGPLHEQTGLIHAAVDKDDIIRSRYDLDVSGHYARPDLFTLSQRLPDDHPDVQDSHEPMNKSTQSVDE